MLAVGDSHNFVFGEEARCLGMPPGEEGEKIEGFQLWSQANAGRKAVEGGGWGGLKAFDTSPSSKESRASNYWKN